MIFFILLLTVVICDNAFFYCMSIDIYEEIIDVIFCTYDKDIYFAIDDNFPLQFSEAVQ